MKIFISIKYDKDGSNNKIIGVIKDAIVKSGNIPYSFADEGYISDEKEMMKKAIRGLEQCNIIVAETSDCAFGVGIEAGYMLARNKPIISIKNKQNVDSPTMKGISNKYIDYFDVNDLREKLLIAIKEVTNE